MVKLVLKDKFRCFIKPGVYRKNGVRQRYKYLCYPPKAKKEISTSSQPLATRTSRPRCVGKCPDATTEKQQTVKRVARIIRNAPPTNVFPETDGISDATDPYVVMPKGKVNLPLKRIPSLDKFLTGDKSKAVISPIPVTTMGFDGRLESPLKGTNGVIIMSTPSTPRTKKRVRGRKIITHNYSHGAFDLTIPQASQIKPEIKASGSGRVLFARKDKEYGKTVVIGHTPNLITYYAHLDTIDVKEGDMVTTGNPIGKMGKTGYVRRSKNGDGTHSHFGIAEDFIVTKGGSLVILRPLSERQIAVYMPNPRKTLAGK